MEQTIGIGAFAGLAEAVGRMIAAVENRIAGGVQSTAAVRWQASLPPVEPLSWLARQPARVRLYCSDRGQQQIAAIGIADMICVKESVPPAELLTQIFSRLAVLPAEARYYGGMRFSAAAPPGDTTWRQFGHLRFVLPAIELICEGGQTVLAAQLAASANQRDHAVSLLAQLTALRRPAELPPAQLPPALGRTDVPPRPAWGEMIRQAQAQMDRGGLRKVVLARRCSLDFGTRLYPMALLQRLLQVTPESFHFCFNYGDEIAFIGATPERLYRRRGRSLVSEALAGTRRRGADPLEDCRLGAELLACGKEREEHRLVVDSICHALTPFCRTLAHQPVPQVMKLGRVQHLHTEISGELLPGVSDLQLLLALHPTPAVGGEPRDEAMRQIGRLEPFDRGWYAAPIGWVMRDRAEFAVAIRCALVEGPRLALFSGAGIMPASDPEREWQEIDNKIENFLHMFRA
jgi:menaquinone-specific isochorismate synthase